MSRSITLSTAMLAAAMTIAGCSKKEATPVDTATPAVAAPTPSPTAATALSVVDVDLGRHLDASKKVSDKTDNFAPKDTIYASVHTSGAAANQTIAARWTFQDGQTVDEHSQTISPTGDAYTEFHIVKPTGWPKGKYTLHLLVNGAETQTKDATVK
jgi:hypothetical protein